MSGRGAFVGQAYGVPVGGWDVAQHAVMLQAEAALSSNLVSSIDVRIEQALVREVDRATRAPCPPGLAEGIRYAVLAGGGRVRPRLCLAVATGCGDPHPALTDAAAAAVEVLHAASLVHDDLPCFDDAEYRRGRPALHRRLGEPLAVLTGDALIVMAFAALDRDHDPTLARKVSCELARGAGAPGGVVAGQAWESEAAVDLEHYHRAKTAALFEAAAAAGAVSAGGDPEPWRPVGRALGEAYQIADDLADLGAHAQAGKPVGRDRARGRPNLALQVGPDAALERFHAARARALAAVPACSRCEHVRAVLADAADRLLPHMRGIAADKEG